MLGFYGKWSVWTECFYFTCNFDPSHQATGFGNVSCWILLSSGMWRRVIWWICGVASQETFTSIFMAVSRAVIKTLSDTRDFMGFLRKQHGAIFKQTRLNGKITLRVRSGAALTKMAGGSQSAGGVTHVDSRMRPGGHQACGGCDVERCQLDATEVFIADLIACSTCFGHHYVQHPANRTHNPHLHTRPATWKPQHEIPEAATTV